MKITAKLRNRITFVFAILAFGAVVVPRQYCTLHMPETPQPEIGRTIPIGANYGKTVYLTRSEARYMDLAFSVAIGSVSVVAAAILSHAWQQFKEAKNEGA
jgi:hypothetical protein